MRNKRIDAVKGIGILLVIIGHINVHRYINTFIYLFHMPLFFIVSGYLYRDNYNFVKSKLKGLLWPYFTIGGSYLVIEMICDAILDKFYLINEIQKLCSLIYGNQFILVDNNIVGTLWFLPALFWSNIIFYLIDRKCELRMCIAVSFVVQVISIIMLSFFGLRIPMCFEISLTAIGFYAFGYLLKKIDLLDVTYKFPKALILGGGRNTIRDY